MSRSATRDPFEYTDWANRRCEAMLAAQDAGLEEARRLYDHVLAAEHIWLCRILGKVSEHDVFPSFERDAAAALREELHRGYGAVLGGDVDLDRIVEYTTTTGEDHATPLGELLAHVVNHGSYHRGQIARIVRQAGHTPLETDRIVWARERSS